MRDGPLLGWAATSAGHLGRGCCIAPRKALRRVSAGCAQGRGTLTRGFSCLDTADVDRGRRGRCCRQCMRMEAAGRMAALWRDGETARAGGEENVPSSDPCVKGRQLPSGGPIEAGACRARAFVPSHSLRDPLSLSSRPARPAARPSLKLTLSPHHHSLQQPCSPAPSSPPSPPSSSPAVSVRHCLVFFLVAHLVPTAVSAQTCARNYTVKAGDICDSISAAQNVSTFVFAPFSPTFPRSCSFFSPQLPARGRQPRHRHPLRQPPAG